MDFCFVGLSISGQFFSMTDEVLEERTREMNCLSNMLHVILLDLRMVLVELVKLS